MSARDKLVIPMALVISLAWIGALASGVFTQNYAPFEVATPVMILLAGYVFGVQIVRNTGDKNGN